MQINYSELKEALAARGKGYFISIYEDYAFCRNKRMFLMEYCWIICQSGTNEEDALLMENATRIALLKNCLCEYIFDNSKKYKCITSFLEVIDQVFSDFKNAKNDMERLEVLLDLDYIDKNDAYLFARNLGISNMYVDNESINKLAQRMNVNPRQLIEEIAKDTSDSIEVIELVLSASEEMGLTCLV